MNNGNDLKIKLPPVNAFKNIFGEEIYKTVNDYLIKKGYEAVSSIKISNEKIYRFNKVSDNALNNLKKISDSDEFIYKIKFALVIMKHWMCVIYEESKCG